MGSIPGLGRSPGGWHGNLSSILAWRIPWTEEPDSPVGYKEWERAEPRSASQGHEWVRPEGSYTELGEGFPGLAPLCDCVCPTAQGPPSPLCPG